MVVGAEAEEHLGLVSTPIATTGPSGASRGTTTAATAAYQASTSARNAALAYDGTGKARGGAGIHTGPPWTLRASIAGSRRIRSG